MFGIRENKFEPEIIVTRIGKIYRVDTRKRFHGKDPETFVETKYSRLLSDFECEREDSHPDETQVALQYSPSKPESL